MTTLEKISGQEIDYKESNDNAPPSYSAPKISYKNVLKSHANADCSRCVSTGYIGSFKSISAGRCFKCLPDDYWDSLLGETKAVGTNDNTQEEVCEIRYVTEKVYSESGFGVFEVGIPPVGEFELFSTYEEALVYAKKHYNI
jgi:hypothetical protein